MKDTGSYIVGRVGSTMKKEVYPYIVEHGRKRGKAPPPGALDRWVRIVLGKRTRREIRSTAFLIGRKIARRGIMGKFPLRKAYFKNKAKVEGYFNGALRMITKELAGK